MSLPAKIQHLTPFEPGHDFGNGGKREYPLTEAVELQKLCMKLARQPKVRAIDLAALARAWDILEDRKRILRGRPLPGQLRPDSLPGKGVKRGRVIELVEEPREAPEQPTPAAATDARQTTAQTPAEEKSKNELDTKAANPPQ